MTKFVADKVEDRRNKNYITHDIEDMLKQRVYGLIGGYEDLNDHILIRKDSHFQTLVGPDKELASSATLSRFENSMTKKDINNLFSFNSNIMMMRGMFLYICLYKHES